MGERREDQVLDDYLNGDSPLSQRYHSEANAVPPAQLDAEIIAAASWAVSEKPESVLPHSRWYVPLSLAAVVIISFSLVFRIYDEESSPASKQSVLSDEDAVIMQGGRLDDKTDSSTGSLTKQKNGEMDAFEPEGVGDALHKSPKRELAPLASPEVFEYRAQEKSSTDTFHDEQINKPATPAMNTIESKTAPAELNAEIYSEEAMQEQAGRQSGSGLVSKETPQQWFEIINQLWFEGDSKGAYAGVKEFLKAYPDYPMDELKKALPQNMDLSKIDTVE